MCDKKKVLGKLKTDRDPWDCFVTSVVSNLSVVLSVLGYLELPELLLSFYSNVA